MLVCAGGAVATVNSAPGGAVATVGSARGTADSDAAGRAEDEGAGWHATANQFELRDNYVTTDPKQIGALANSFQLAPESPAWKTGFKPIPFEQIGIRPNPDRARLAKFE